MTVLNLPETAKIVKRQKCPVKTFTTGNYTTRTGFSPLAEISIECELDQGDANSLVFEIEQAAGINQLELPYISSAEKYLVQEYKVTPLLFNKIAKLELKMVQQRSTLLPENPRLITVLHVPLYDSTETGSFRNISKQLSGGVVATKARGTHHSKERYWDVKFFLTLAEVQALDQQLAEKRGVYSFRWSPNQDPDSKEQWFCAEWEIEYFATDLHIFNGVFLHDNGTETEPSIEIITVSADPLMLLEGTSIFTISASASQLTLIEGNNSALVTIFAENLTIKEGDIASIILISANPLTISEETSTIISLSASTLNLIEGT